MFTVSASAFVRRFFSPVCTPTINFGIIIIKRVRKFKKSDYYLRHIYLSVCPSVRLHVTTRLSLNGFREILYLSIFGNLSIKFSFH